MYLRGGECGMSREVSVTNADAERYEAALHSRASIISRAMRRLEIDRMAAEVASFVAALQRDLLDAADFARSRPSRPRRTKSRAAPRAAPARA